MEEAIKMISEAIKVNEASIIQSTRDIFRRVKWFKEAGHIDKAIAFCREAVKIFDKTIGRDTEHTANLLYLLHTLYKSDGRLKDAAGVMVEVIRVRELVMSDDNPVLAVTYNNASIIFATLGCLVEAENCCRKAIKVRLKEEDVNFQALLCHYNNLGVLCKRLYKFQDAIKCFKKALELTSYPEMSSSNAGGVKCNLGQVYLSQGRLKEAEMIFKEVISDIYSHKDFSVIGSSKPIWEVAEVRQARQTKRVSTTSDHGIRKITKEDKTALLTALHFLQLLYNFQLKDVARKTIKEAIMGLRNTAIEAYSDDAVEDEIP